MITVVGPANKVIFSVLRDDLAAARAVLKKHSMMLLTASKAYVRHPELSAAKANRDYVLRQVCEAVNTISDVAQGNNPGQDSTDTGELAAALDEFDNSVIMNPLTYEDRSARPSLEERLESIVSGAALLADSSCTRDDRKEKIVTECNAVRQALQVSLSVLSIVFCCIISVLMFQSNLILSMSWQFLLMLSLQ